MLRDRFRVVVIADRDIGGGCGQVQLEREVELPFAPSPGLELANVFMDDDLVEIEDVEWCLSGERFAVYGGTYSPSAKIRGTPDDEVRHYFEWSGNTKVDGFDTFGAWMAAQFESEGGPRQEPTP